MTRWKKRAAAASALGLAGLAVLLWSRLPLPGAIVDLQPVGAQRVLVMRHDERANRQDGYLELVEAQKGVVWRSKLPGARVWSGPWSHVPNAVAGPGVFVLRSTIDAPAGTSGYNTPRLQGFRAEDGALLWTVSPMAGKEDESDSAFRLLKLSLLAHGDLVLAFYGRESLPSPLSRTEIIALDARSGAERWRAVREDVHSPGPAWIRGGSLVVREWNDLSVIDLATGKVTARVAIDEAPCVTDRAVWFTSGGALHELALDSLAERTLPAPTEGRFELHGLCGRRGDELWMFTSEYRGEIAAPDGHVTAYAPARLLAIDPVTGTVRRRVELGRVRLGTPADGRLRERAPDEAPLSGEPARFLPLLIEEATAPFHLVMVDLDEARLAWQSPPSPRLLHAHVERAGGRHYLFQGTSRLLASLDGATGRVLAAVTWPALEAPVLSLGRVWIRDDREISNLDDATMKPIWASGAVSISDGRADAEALLAGAPR